MLRRLGPLLAALLLAASLPAAFPSPLPPSRAPVPPLTTLALTEATFANELARHGRLFIKFFAPWCGHCRNLAPTWDKVAAAAHAKPHPLHLELKKARASAVASPAAPVSAAEAANSPAPMVSGSYPTPTTVAEVDCTTNGALCREFKVSGYPTIALVQAPGVGNVTYFIAPLTAPATVTANTAAFGAAASAYPDEDGLVLNYTPLPTPHAAAAVAPALITPSSPATALDTAAAAAAAAFALELSAAAAVSAALPGGVGRFGGRRDFAALLEGSVSTAISMPLPSKYQAKSAGDAAAAASARANDANGARTGAGVGSIDGTWLGYHATIFFVAVLAFACGFLLNATVCQLDLGAERRSRALLASTTVSSSSGTIRSSSSSSMGGKTAAAVAATDDECDDSNLDDDEEVGARMIPLRQV